MNGTVHQQDGRVGVVFGVIVAKHIILGYAKFVQSFRQTVLPPSSVSPNWAWIREKLTLALEREAGRL